MSDLENKPSVSVAAPIKEDSSDLPRRLNFMLITVVVNSLILTAFLALSSVRASRELDLIRPVGQSTVQGLKQVEPALAEFRAKLADFARTHPDFVPIAIRHGIVAPPVQGQVPPAPAPAPNR